MSNELRRRAEARLTEKNEAMPNGEQDLQRLVHELRVHQIELELQNEELDAARVQAEQALAEAKLASDGLRLSEQRLRLWLENSVDAVFIIDPAGRFLFANPAAARLFGYSRDELQRMSVLDTVPPVEREVTVHRFQAFRDAHYFRHEINIRHKDGRILPFDLQAIVMPDGNGYAALRDISARKQAEAEQQRFAAELRQSNAELNAFNKMMIGRELNMVELKKQVNALCRALGKEPPYPVGFPPERANIYQYYSGCWT